jgi:hypothetical protein
MLTASQSMQGFINYLLCLLCACVVVDSEGRARRSGSELHWPGSAHPWELCRACCRSCLRLPQLCPLGGLCGRASFDSSALVTFTSSFGLHTKSWGSCIHVGVHLLPSRGHSEPGSVRSHACINHRSGWDWYFRW